jgi:putative addiction module component (TIGR02574 family)
MSTLTPEIARLTLAERIQLVEDLWDSIASEVDTALPFSSAQIAELHRRAQAHEESAEAAIPWEQLRSELTGRST